MFTNILQVYTTNMQTLPVLKVSHMSNFKQYEISTLELTVIYVNSFDF